MTTQFVELTDPTSSHVEVFNKWDNDPYLIPLTRPNKNKAELDRRDNMTLADLNSRMEHHHIFLIYHNDQLIGEMNYMVDPGHLYKKESGTAWIGVTIGESEGRGKGIGFKAIQYLEDQIRKRGHSRIELGVFEFNTHAQMLYHKLGYQVIGYIDNFTFWQDKMWTDIRMEKYL